MVLPVRDSSWMADWVEQALTLSSPLEIRRHSKSKIKQWCWCRWKPLLTALIRDPSLQNKRNPFSNITLEGDELSRGIKEKRAKEKLAR